MERAIKALRDAQEHTESRLTEHRKHLAALERDVESASASIVENEARLAELAKAIEALS